MFRTYFHFSSFAPNFRGTLQVKGALSPLSLPSENLPQYSFQIARNFEQFKALEDDWNTLFSHSTNKDQPFQSFAWHKQWCQAYLDMDKPNKKEDAPLYVITLWKQDKSGKNDRLVMLWPMQIKTFFGRNHLHFMGDPVSQYGDVLLDENEDSLKILHETWRFLQKNTVIDLCIFRKVKETSSLSPLLRDLKATQTESEQGLYINFKNYPDYDHYQQRFKRKERKNRSRKYRRLEQKGPIRVTFLTAGVEASYIARQAIALKQKWLEEKGLFSKAFQNEKMALFFAQIAQSKDKNITPNVSVLHVGNKPAAITISFGAKGYRAMHINVIDLAFEKDSPGVALLEQTIENSINQGDQILDFLAPADPYKTIWCDQIHYVSDYTLSTNITGRLYTNIALKWIRHGGKSVLQTMPKITRSTLHKIIPYLLGKSKK